MEAEWSRTLEGKLGLDRLIPALREAAAPVGVRDLEWEFRRATLTRDEITYKFDQYDDRETVERLYAEPVGTVYMVIALYSTDSREVAATAHLTYDGARTRLRVESSSVHLLERLREQFR
jgi:hypothetical protein